MKLLHFDFGFCSVALSRGGVAAQRSRLPVRLATELGGADTLTVARRCPPFLVPLKYRRYDSRSRLGI